MTLQLNVFILGIIMAFPQLSAKSTELSDWEQFKDNYYSFNEVHMGLDFSRMSNFNYYKETLSKKMKNAFVKMQQLEAGSIANPDEGWQVGHYWLREPSLAPDLKINTAISHTLNKIIDFTNKVHQGAIHGQKGPFKNLLLIGIGGSALGPQFVSQALANPKEDKLAIYYIDNTDPDGIDLIWQKLGDQLGETLVLVVSKSGGTPETRNGMLEAKHQYQAQSLDFSKHAVAITVEGSKLAQLAQKEQWLETFPIWEWVGGRTSEFSAVGLLPAALQGIDIQQLIEGARAMDKLTRKPEIKENPAALLALAWYSATNGKGEKDMIIIPYKDRLNLLAKYLQQLIMESLGKEKNLKGRVVRQGIAVYGNKGSTDQHSYIQQLRDGVHNFFVTFVEVLKDRERRSIEVEPGRTSGDYLHAFFLGTREALSGNNRDSLTITIEQVSPFSSGAMIALYERAVGFYASLIGINAYHQPGVEAGKKAASSTLELKSKIKDFLKEHPNKYFEIPAIASEINEDQKLSVIYKLLEHMAHNDENIHRKKNNAFYLNQYAFMQSSST